MIHSLCQEFLHMVNIFLWSSGSIYFLFVLNICPWLGWNVLGLDFLGLFFLFSDFSFSPFSRIRFCARP